MSSQIRRQGLLLCLVGPSGAGKTEFASRLTADFSDLQLSVSATSRAARSGEIPGQSYHFLTREEFLSRVGRDEFVEHEEVHGNLYGTLKSTVQDAVSNGRDLLLDIDVRGAFTFKRLYPFNSVVCFIVPPAFSVLKDRILGRSTLSENELNARLNTARAEYAVLEKAKDEAGKVDYLLVNDQRDECYKNLISVLLAERNRFSRLDQSELNKLLSAN